VLCYQTDLIRSLQASEGKSISSGLASPFRVGMVVVLMVVPAFINNLSLGVQALCLLVVVLLTAC
jgi:hypothetical protein